jgi:hypothetical protein
LTEKPSPTPPQDATTPTSIEPNLYFDCPIISNEKETFSAIILRPGVNDNGYYYSREDCLDFSNQVLSVPLVIDHGDSARDNIGKFIGNGVDRDGNATAKFTVSSAEPVILSKIKDGTINHVSVRHTFTEAGKYCSICGKSQPPHRDHIPLETYNGQRAGIGFKQMRLLHVSVVSVAADKGCHVLENALRDTAKSWSLEAESLKVTTSKMAGELEALRAENTRLKGFHQAEPAAKITVTPPPPPRTDTRRATWLGIEDE